MPKRPNTTPVEQPAKRPRGRPPGSKNVKKLAVDSVAVRSLAPLGETERAVVPVEEAAWIAAEYASDNLAGTIDTDEFWARQLSGSQGPVYSGLATTLSLAGSVTEAVTRLGIRSLEEIGRLQLPLVSPALKAVSAATRKLYIIGKDSVTALLMAHPDLIVSVLGATISAALAFLLGQYVNPLGLIDWEQASGYLTGLVSVLTGSEAAAGWGESFVAILRSGSGLLSGAVSAMLLTNVTAYLVTPTLGELFTGRSASQAEIRAGLKGSLQYSRPTTQAPQRRSLANMVSLVGYASLLGVAVVQIGKHGLAQFGQMAFAQMGEVITKTAAAVSRNGILSFSTLTFLTEMFGTYVVFVRNMLADATLWGTLQVIVGWFTSLIMQLDGKKTLGQADSILLFSSEKFREVADALADTETGQLVTTGAGWVKESVSGAAKDVADAAGAALDTIGIETAAARAAKESNWGFIGSIASAAYGLCSAILGAIQSLLVGTWDWTFGSLFAVLKAALSAAMNFVGYAASGPGALVAMVAAGCIVYVLYNYRNLFGQGQLDTIKARLAPTLRPIVLGVRTAITDGLTWLKPHIDIVMPYAWDAGVFTFRTTRNLLDVAGNLVSYAMASPAGWLWKLVHASGRLLVTSRPATTAYATLFDYTQRMLGRLLGWLTTRYGQELNGMSLKALAKLLAGKAWQAVVLSDSEQATRALDAWVLVQEALQADDAALTAAEQAFREASLSERGKGDLEVVQTLLSVFGLQASIFLAEFVSTPTAFKLGDTDGRRVAVANMAGLIAHMRQNLAVRLEKGEQPRAEDTPTLQGGGTIVTNLAVLLKGVTQAVASYKFNETFRGALNRHFEYLANPPGPAGAVPSLPEDVIMKRPAYGLTALECLKTLRAHLPMDGQLISFSRGEEARTSLEPPASLKPPEALQPEAISSTEIATLAPPEPTWFTSRTTVAQTSPLLYVEAYARVWRYANDALYTRTEAMINKRVISREYNGLKEAWDVELGGQDSIAYKERLIEEAVNAQPETDSAARARAERSARLGIEDCEAVLRVQFSPLFAKREYASGYLTVADALLKSLKPLIGLLEWYGARTDTASVLKESASKAQAGLGAVAAEAESYWAEFHQRVTELEKSPYLGIESTLPLLLNSIVEPVTEEAFELQYGTLDKAKELVAGLVDLLRPDPGPHELATPFVRAVVLPYIYNPEAVDPAVFGGKVLKVFKKFKTAYPSTLRKLLAEASEAMLEWRKARPDEADGISYTAARYFHQTFITKLHDWLNTNYPTTAPFFYANVLQATNSWYRQQNPLGDGKDYGFLQITQHRQGTGGPADEKDTTDPTKENADLAILKLQLDAKRQEEEARKRAEKKKAAEALEEDPDTLGKALEDGELDEEAGDQLDEAPEVLIMALRDTWAAELERPLSDPEQELLNTMVFVIVANRVSVVQVIVQANRGPKAAKALKEAWVAAEAETIGQFTSSFDNLKNMDYSVNYWTLQFKQTANGFVRANNLRAINWKETQTLAEKLASQPLKLPKPANPKVSVPTTDTGRIDVDAWTKKWAKLADTAGGGAKRAASKQVVGALIEALLKKTTSGETIAPVSGAKKTKVDEMLSQLLAAIRALLFADKLPKAAGTVAELVSVLEKERLMTSAGIKIGVYEWLQKIQQDSSTTLTIQQVILTLIEMGGGSSRPAPPPSLVGKLDLSRWLEDELKGKGKAKLPSGARKGDRAWLAALIDLLETKQDDLGKVAPQVDRAKLLEWLKNWQTVAAYVDPMAGGGQVDTGIKISAIVEALRKSVERPADDLFEDLELNEAKLVSNWQYRPGDQKERPDYGNVFGQLGKVSGFAGFLHPDAPDKNTAKPGPARLDMKALENKLNTELGKIPPDSGTPKDYEEFLKGLKKVTDYKEPRERLVIESPVGKIAGTGDVHSQFAKAANAVLQACIAGPETNDFRSAATADPELVPTLFNMGEMFREMFGQVGELGVEIRKAASVSNPVEFANLFPARFRPYLASVRGTLVERIGGAAGLSKAASWSLVRVLCETVIATNPTTASLEPSSIVWALITVPHSNPLELLGVLSTWYKRPPFNVHLLDSRSLMLARMSLTNQGGPEPTSSQAGKELIIQAYRTAWLQALNLPSGTAFTRVATNLTDLAGRFVLSGQSWDAFSAPLGAEVANLKSMTLLEATLQRSYWFPLVPVAKNLVNAVPSARSTIAGPVFNLTQHNPLEFLEYSFIKRLVDDAVAEEAEGRAKFAQIAKEMYGETQVKETVESVQRSIFSLADTLGLLKVHSAYLVSSKKFKQKLKAWVVSHLVGAFQAATGVEDVAQVFVEAIGQIVDAYEPYLYKTAYAFHNIVLCSNALLMRAYWWRFVEVAKAISNQIPVLMGITDAQFGALAPEQIRSDAKELLGAMRTGFVPWQLSSASGESMADGAIALVKKSASDDDKEALVKMFNVRLKLAEWAKKRLEPNIQIVKARRITLPDATLKDYYNGQHADAALQAPGGKIARCLYCEGPIVNGRLLGPGSTVTHGCGEPVHRMCAAQDQSAASEGHPARNNSICRAAPDLRKNTVYPVAALWKRYAIMAGRARVLPGVDTGFIRSVSFGAEGGARVLIAAHVLARVVEGLTPCAQCEFTLFVIMQSVYDWSATSQEAIATLLLMWGTIVYAHSCVGNSSNTHLTSLTDAQIDGYATSLRLAHSSAPARLTPQRLGQKVLEAVTNMELVLQEAELQAEVSGKFMTIQRTDTAYILGRVEEAGLANLDKWPCWGKSWEAAVTPLYTPMITFVWEPLDYVNYTDTDLHGSFRVYDPISQEDYVRKAILFGASFARAFGTSLGSRRAAALLAVGTFRYVVHSQGPDDLYNMLGAVWATAQAATRTVPQQASLPRFITILNDLLSGRSLIPITERPTGWTEDGWQSWATALNGAYVAGQAGTEVLNDLISYLGQSLTLSDVPMPGSDYIESVPTSPLPRAAYALSNVVDEATVTKTQFNTIETYMVLRDDWADSALYEGPTTTTGWLLTNLVNAMADGKHVGGTGPGDVAYHASQISAFLGMYTDFQAAPTAGARYRILLQILTALGCTAEVAICQKRIRAADALETVSNTGASLWSLISKKLAGLQGLVGRQGKTQVALNVEKEPAQQALMLVEAVSGTNRHFSPVFEVRKGDEMRVGAILANLVTGHVSAAVEVLLKEGKLEEAAVLGRVQNAPPRAVGRFQRQDKPAVETSVIQLKDSQINVERRHDTVFAMVKRALDVSGGEEYYEGLGGLNVAYKTRYFLGDFARRYTLLRQEVNMAICGLTATDLSENGEELELLTLKADAAFFALPCSACADYSPTDARFHLGCCNKFICAQCYRRYHSPPTKDTCRNCDSSLLGKVTQSSVQKLEDILYGTILWSRKEAPSWAEALDLLGRAQVGTTDFQIEAEPASRFVYSPTSFQVTLAAYMLGVNEVTLTMPALERKYINKYKDKDKPNELNFGAVLPGSNQPSKALNEEKLRQAQIDALIGSYLPALKDQTINTDLPWEQRRALSSYLKHKTRAENAERKMHIIAEGLREGPIGLVLGDGIEGSDSFNTAVRQWLGYYNERTLLACALYIEYRVFQKPGPIEREAIKAEDKENAVLLFADTAKSLTEADAMEINFLRMISSSPRYNTAGGRRGPIVVPMYMKMKQIDMESWASQTLHDDYNMFQKWVLEMYEPGVLGAGDIATVPQDPHTRAAVRRRIRAILYFLAFPYNAELRADGVFFWLGSVAQTNLSAAAWFHQGLAPKGLSQAGFESIVSPLNTRPSGRTYQVPTGAQLGAENLGRRWVILAHRGTTWQGAEKTRPAGPLKTEDIFELANRRTTEALHPLCGGPGGPGVEDAYLARLANGYTYVGNIGTQIFPSLLHKGILTFHEQFAQMLRKRVREIAGDFSTGSPKVFNPAYSDRAEERIDCVETMLEAFEASVDLQTVFDELKLCAAAASNLLSCWRFQGEWASAQLRMAHYKAVFAKYAPRKVTLQYTEDGKLIPPPPPPPPGGNTYEPGEFSDEEEPKQAGPVSLAVKEAEAFWAAHEEAYVKMQPLLEKLWGLKRQEYYDAIKAEYGPTATVLLSILQSSDYPAKPDLQLTEEGIYRALWDFVNKPGEGNMGWYALNTALMKGKLEENTEWLKIKLEEAADPGFFARRLPNIPRVAELLGKAQEEMDKVAVERKEDSGSGSVEPVPPPPPPPLPEGNEPPPPPPQEGNLLKTPTRTKIQRATPKPAPTRSMVSHAEALKVQQRISRRKAIEKGEVMRFYMHNYRNYLEALLQHIELRTDQVNSLVWKASQSVSSELANGIAANFSRRRQIMQAVEERFGHVFRFNLEDPSELGTLRWLAPIENFSLTQDDIVGEGNMWMEIGEPIVLAVSLSFLSKFASLNALRSSGTMVFSIEAADLLRSVMVAARNLAGVITNVTRLLLARKWEKEDLGSFSLTMPVVQDGAAVSRRKKWQVLAMYVKYLLGRVPTLEAQDEQGLALRQKLWWYEKTYSQQAVRDAELIRDYSTNIWPGLAKRRLQAAGTADFSDVWIETPAGPMSDRELEKLAPIVLLSYLPNYLSASGISTLTNKITAEIARMATWFPSLTQSEMIGAFRTAVDTYGPYSASSTVTFRASGEVGEPSVGSVSVAMLADLLDVVEGSWLGVATISLDPGAAPVAGPTYKLLARPAALESGKDSSDTVPSEVGSLTSDMDYTWAPETWKATVSELPIAGMELGENTAKTVAPPTPYTKEAALAFQSSLNPMDAEDNMDSVSQVGTPKPYGDYRSRSDSSSSATTVRTWASEPKPEGRKFTTPITGMFKRMLNLGEVTVEQKVQAATGKASLGELIRRDTAIKQSRKKREPAEVYSPPSSSIDAPRKVYKPGNADTRAEAMAIKAEQAKAAAARKEAARKEAKARKEAEANALKEAEARKKTSRLRSTSTSSTATEALNPSKRQDVDKGEEAAKQSLFSRLTWISKK